MSLIEASACLGRVRTGRETKTARGTAGGIWHLGHLGHLRHLETRVGRGAEHWTQTFAIQRNGPTK